MVRVTVAAYPNPFPPHLGLIFGEIVRRAAKRDCSQHAAQGRLAVPVRVVQGVLSPGPSRPAGDRGCWLGRLPAEGSQVPLREVRQPTDRSCDDGEGCAAGGAVAG
jgi:hypothetical protein